MPRRAARGPTCRPSGGPSANGCARPWPSCPSGAASRSCCSTWHGVLARWARAGVTAAALIALVAGYLVGRAPRASALTVAEALIAPPAQAPVVEVVLASVIGNER